MRKGSTAHSPMAQGGQGRPRAHVPCVTQDVFQGMLDESNLVPTIHGLGSTNKGCFFQMKVSPTARRAQMEGAW